MTFGKQGRTYRRISSQSRDALFSFGWGLTYSRFSYSQLRATKKSVSVTVTNVGKKAGAEVAQLYFLRPKMNTTIKENGIVCNQLHSNDILSNSLSDRSRYLSLDGAGSALPPVPYALAGFEKVMLAPGASTTVMFTIDSEKSLTVVNANGAREMAKGPVSVSVGGHLPSDPRAKLATNAKHASNIVTGSFAM